jgi:23S rRNA pseudouridine1911/1915/1917 synthase
MKEVIDLIVQDGFDIRIDKYLADKLPDYTRTFIQKLITSGNITVNEAVINARYKVKSNDKVTVCVPEPVDIEILPEDIPLDIIYQDDEIVIVNKPQGMVVHPAPGNYTGTLVNALLFHLKDQLSSINGEIRPGIVHRIDKDTSGLLMIAKNDKTHLYLSNLLKDHNIKRQYHAVVHGTFKDTEGIVELPIGRDPRDRKKMAITKDGRYAKTHYKVLETYKNFSYLELTLFTGRTHQIRVHMKHIGHPILGDMVYGPNNKTFGLDKQTLHAKVLGFVHPKTQQYLEFDSELPPYFTAIVNKLRKLQ